MVLGEGSGATTRDMGIGKCCDGFGGSPVINQLVKSRVNDCGGEGTILRSYKERCRRDNVNIDESYSLAFTGRACKRGTSQVQQKLSAQ